MVLYLPDATHVLAGSSESVPLGLLQGGQAITKCKDKFRQLLELLIKIASLQVTRRCYRNRTRLRS